MVILVVVVLPQACGSSSSTSGRAVPARADQGRPSRARIDLHCPPDRPRAARVAVDPDDATASPTEPTTSGRVYADWLTRHSELGDVLGARRCAAISSTNWSSPSRPTVTRHRPSAGRTGTRRESSSGSLRDDRRRRMRLRDLAVKGCRTLYRRVDYVPRPVATPRRSVDRVDAGGNPQSLGLLGVVARELGELCSAGTRGRRRAAARRRRRGDGRPSRG